MQDLSRLNRPQLLDLAKRAKAESDKPGLSRAALEKYAALLDAIRVRLAASAKVKTLGELTPEELAERGRKLQRQRFDADRHDELVKLAEGTTPAEAADALRCIELQEADETGALKFELTEREHAAALLLRGDREYKAALADVGKRLDTSAQALDALAAGTTPRSDFEAEERDRLVTLADDLPAAVAERALELLQLEEADESGSLRFGLSERERAGALLLREDQ